MTAPVLDLPRPPRSATPAPAHITAREIVHRVCLNLDKAPPIDTGLGTRTPRGLRLEYVHTPERERVRVEVEFQHDAQLLPPRYWPDWVAALVELHRTSPDLRPAQLRADEPGEPEPRQYPPLVPGDLGGMVVQHMERYTHDPCGDYEVAVDHGDGSVVVVWRQGMWGGMQGVRGTMLYRWLCSLRTAGFTAEPRLDMAPFGRPDEHAEIAWWLHVTAWSDPAGGAS